jgi:hypothetical protein
MTSLLLKIRKPHLRELYEGRPCSVITLGNIWRETSRLKLVEIIRDDLYTFRHGFSHLTSYRMCFATVVSLTGIH